MKGWVYIITTKSMPHLLKVGFTRKDPEYRAAELNSTGNPHPYVVNYEVLVDDPERVESKAHAQLSDYKEGKEWFHCDIPHAISAIQQASGGTFYLENIKGTDAPYIETDVRKISEAKGEEQRLRELEYAREARVSQWRNGVRQQFKSLESEKYSQLNQTVEKSVQKTPYWMAWGATSLGVAIALSFLTPNFERNTGTPGFIIACAMFSLLPAVWVQSLWNKESGATQQEENLSLKTKEQLRDLERHYPHEVDEKYLVFNELDTRLVAGNAGLIDDGDSCYLKGALENTSQHQIRSIELSVSDRESGASATSVVDVFMNGETKLEFKTHLKIKPKQLTWSVSKVFGYYLEVVA